LTLIAIINEMEDFLQNHPNIRKLLDFLKQKINVKHSVVQSETVVDFYKLNFRCSLNKRCPFSLWIERSTDEIIFFNIGAVNQEAVVLHYWDISSRDSLEESFIIIDRLLSNSMLETQLYCNGRLKKVNYKGRKDEYTCLVENTFLCLKKKTLVYQYEPW